MSLSRRRLLLAGALGLSWTPFGLASCGDNSTPVDPPVDNGTGNTTAPPNGTGNTTPPGDNTTGVNNTVDNGTGGSTDGNTVDNGTGASTGGGGTPPTPNGPRVRYNLLSSQGQAMLAIYAAGVKAMKALPDNDPKSWTFWWYTHMTPQQRGGKSGEINRIFGAGASAAKTLATLCWDTCQSHNHQDPNFFLPWHRMYVAAFEDVIRQVTGQANFTLPYWSYTDPGGAVLPAQFRQAGSSQWGSLYYASRKAGINGGQTLGPQAVFNLDDMRSPTYAQDGGDVGFCANLDGNLHGLVHTSIGGALANGMSAVPWAANDPIFWVHHCNIDRIWASWNAGGGVNPTDFGFANKTFDFATPAGVRKVYAIRDVLSTAAAGYGFDHLEGAQTTAFSETMAAPAAGGANTSLRSARRSLPMVKAGAPTPMATPNASVSAVGRLQGVVATPSITHIAQAITLGATPTRITLAQAASAPGVIARALPPHGDIVKSLRRSAPLVVGAAAPSARMGAAPAASGAAPAAAVAAPAQTLPAPGPGQRALLVLNGLEANIQPGVVYGVYLEAPTRTGGREKIMVGTLNFFSALSSMSMPGMRMPKNPRPRAVSFDITRQAQSLAAQGRLEAQPQLSFSPLGAAAPGAAPTVQSVSLAIQ